MSHVELVVDNVQVYDNEGSATGAEFQAAIEAAWAADKVLNWQSGDVTITSPIILEVTDTSKFGFGIRLNGARVTCNFANAAAWALTIRMHHNEDGSIVQDQSLRAFQLIEGAFVGSSAYAGALKLECLTNGSWIYSFLIRDINVSGHSEHAFAFVGSVFEFVLDRLTTANGKGALFIEMRGTGVNGTTDMGLPSAMYCYSPNFRDFDDDAILMTSPQAYSEPFDLTVVDGYIVTGQGLGINAPAGITRVEGTGFENLGQTAGKGGSAIYLGFRGGMVKGCRGANPVANSSVETQLGMAYLVNADLANNNLVVEDSGAEAEGGGSQPKVARAAGSGGTIYLNRVGSTSSALDNPNNQTVVNTTP